MPADPGRRMTLTTSPKTEATSPEGFMSMSQDMRLKLMRTLSESPTSAVLGALTQAVSPQRLPGASSRPSIAKPSFEPMKEQPRFNQVLPRLVAGPSGGKMGGSSMMKCPPKVEPEDELNSGLTAKTAAERWNSVNRVVSSISAFSRASGPRIAHFDPGLANPEWRAAEPAFVYPASPARTHASTPNTPLRDRN